MQPTVLISPAASATTSAPRQPPASRPSPLRGATWICLAVALVIPQLRTAALASESDSPANSAETAETAALRGDWRSRPAVERIEVRCGEVGLLLRKGSQWTPGRIDYRNAALSTERSAYGSVFRLDGVGFIGTGHLEVEPEELLELALHADGALVPEPGERIDAAGSFRFHRVSRIRGLELTCTIAIEGDRLYETTAVACDEETPLELVYHFMHAWNPSVRSYLAGTDEDGVVDSGSFADTEEATRKFHVQSPVDWIAVHDPEIGRFAVSRLLAYPEAAGQDSQIWNVPGVYRKYYLTSFRNATVPAGFSGVWEMVTAFGEAEAADWAEAATALASALRGAQMPPPATGAAADPSEAPR